MARPDQIIRQNFNRFNEQLGGLTGQISNNTDIPAVITADQKIINDFSRKTIDASAGDLIVTLQDASKIGDWSWILYRMDEAASTVTLVPEDPTHLINGETEWQIYPGETYVIHAEFDKYTIN